MKLNKDNGSASKVLCRTDSVSDGETEGKQIDMCGCLKRQKR